MTPSPSAASAQPARRLRDCLEPVVGAVYFSPECHRRYEALGFDASPTNRDGVAMPDGPAYFCSRGALLGDAPGEVVAAAFAVFNPPVVAAAVEHGRSRSGASAGTLRTERARGAVEQLGRILGEPAELLATVEALEDATVGLPLAGRPLAAGVAAEAAEPPQPSGSWARLFRAGDLLREFRGDCHNAVWVAAGLSGPEIGLLTELWWGLPLRSYSRTRAWSDEELDAAETSLAERGWLADGSLTDDGRAVREELETRTDALCRPIVDRLGDSFEPTTATLARWASEMVANGAYPGSARSITGP